MGDKVTLAIKRVSEQLRTIFVVCSELSEDALKACRTSGVIKADEVYKIPNGGPLAPMSSQYDFTDQVLLGIFSKGQTEPIELVLGVHEGCIGLPRKPDGARLARDEITPCLEAAERYYKASIERKSEDIKVSTVLVAIDSQTGSVNVVKDLGA